MTERHIVATLLFWVPTGWSLVAWRLLPALGITAAFGLVAWGLRGVTALGALVGTIITLIICIAAGPGGFLTVLVVFILTLLATRFGLHRKLAAGLAEHKQGRNGLQVLANVSVAGILAGSAIFCPRNGTLLLSAMAAALCEAAADTVSSEIGQAAGRRAYMITSLASVQAGTDGGISAPGTFAGAIAASLVALTAVWMAVIPDSWLVPVIVCGFIGMLFDSVLGATLQRPGRLGNSSVNFISSVFSAAVLLSYGLLLMS